MRFSTARQRMTRVPRSSRSEALFVLAARATLLLVALTLVVVSLTIARRSATKAAATPAYSCPMHAEVTSSGPGECPLCKMALERIGGNPDRSGPSREVAGQRPARTRRAPITREEIASSSSPLGATWLPETFPAPEPTQPSDGPALATPRHRTFQDAVRAPAWSDAPGRFAALLYRDELVGLKSGERAAFFRATAPRVPVEVELELDASPPKLWDSSTATVHFVLSSKKGAEARRDAPNVACRVGDVGFVELEPRARELLTIPESAVLRSSEGAYVLVASAGDSFVKRPVELGRSRRAQAVVLSGLGETDRVVARNAFFLDTGSEREHGVEAVAEVGP
jgi:hypothetical protein